MSDPIDRANDTAQEDLDRLLAKAPKFDQPSLTYCMDCDEPIPEARRKLGGVKRCIDCQAVAERRK